MNCKQDTTFWFYWEVGRGGWYAPYSPVKDGLGVFKLPSLSDEQIDLLLSQIAPPESRVSIVEGKGAQFDLKQQQ
jgi:hypothetical protein